jgi:hypothetical protein
MHKKILSDSPYLVPNTNRVNSISQTCRILNIGRSTYYTLRKSGVIAPPVRITKRTGGHTTEYLEGLIKRMGAL